MAEHDAHDPTILRSYEGLVFTTASMVVSELRWRGIQTPDDDLDDVMQLLRVKVYRALLAFNPAKVKRRGESLSDARDRYVFMCVSDMKKDIRKRKRTLVLMIEDESPPDIIDGDRQFDARYLSQTHEETYAQVEATTPLVPNTLTELERSVLVLLYRDYTHREIAARLAVSKGEVSSAVRGLRAKLADWQPAAETAPLPVTA